MRRILLSAAALAVSACALVHAQTSTASARNVLRVFGSATVAVKPDQARLQLGVVTAAATANDAATQNATLAQAVIDALTKVVGSNGSIRTISYSIQANYAYPANQSPTVSGYTATNVVEVLTGDLAGVGRLVDVGIGAGANRVQMLSFELKDDTQARAQALRLAVQSARAKADVMAGALNVKVGVVIALVEGYSSTPISYTVDGAPGAGATPTPISSGNVNVTASVTLDMEILQSAVTATAGAR